MLIIIRILSLILNRQMTTPCEVDLHPEFFLGRWRMKNNWNSWLAMLMVCSTQKTDDHVYPPAGKLVCFAKNVPLNLKSDVYLSRTKVITSIKNKATRT